LQHSEEAERAVLASIFLEPTFWPRVAQRLALKDFAFEKHQLIFEAMGRVVAESQTVDTLTVRAKLEELGTFDLAGGVAYIHTLDVGLPDYTRIDTYVEIVKDRALRRGLADFGLGLTRRAFDPASKGAVVLAKAEADILHFGEKIASRRLERLGPLIEAAVTDLEEEGQGEAPLRTGFPSLDHILGGLGRGRLTVLAGRPGQGKTSVALTIAQDLAIRQGRTVAFFSLEMTNRELTLKILGAETGLPIRQLEKGILSRAQWTQLHQCAARLQSVPLYLDDSSSLTLMELASTVRRLKAQRELDAVVVDYLQLLSAAEAFQNETVALAAISRGLKQLASDLEVPVLLLSQLSRQVERRGPGAPPILSDLRGSGSIEQDADAVVFVWTPESHDGVENSLQALIAKNRHGEEGRADLRFEKATMTLFEEVTDGGQNNEH
jgi:replicative DNA helicase